AASGSSKKYHSLASSLTPEAFLIFKSLFQFENRKKKAHRKSFSAADDFPAN
ncbi:hypothetical protein LINPERHAP1_LOCUS28490, partial [Linum perenne]